MADINNLKIGQKYIINFVSYVENKIPILDENGKILKDINGKDIYSRSYDVYIKSIVGILEKVTDKYLFFDKRKILKKNVRKLKVA